MNGNKSERVRRNRTGGKRRASLWSGFLTGDQKSMHYAGTDVNPNFSGESGGFMETIDSALPIFEFSKNDPPDGEWFAFVCPVEKDRWEVGWRDWYKIRVEGGPSYKPEELTYWTPLPQIPKEQS